MIYDHFGYLSGYTQKEIREFISNMKKLNRHYGSNRFAAIYLLVDDRELFSIRASADYLRENIGRLLKCTGDNLHIFGVFSIGGHNILKELRREVKKRKLYSVSWWNRDLTKFIFRKV